jgi:hypothetical protein
MTAHFVSACCEGEVCVCGRPATHKLGEEFLPDEPFPDRHNLTSYVCCGCFTLIVGAASPCSYGDMDGGNERAVHDRILFAMHSVLSVKRKRAEEAALQRSLKRPGS